MFVSWICEERVLSLQMRRRDILLCDVEWHPSCNGDFSNGEWNSKDCETEKGGEHREVISRRLLQRTMNGYKECHPETWDGILVWLWSSDDSAVSVLGCYAPRTFLNFSMNCFASSMDRQRGGSRRMTLVPEQPVKQCSSLMRRVRGSL